jgi:hypothetical protein
MVAFLCIIAVTIVVGTLSRLPSRAMHWDFSIYYIEAILLHEGNNPYTTDLSSVGDKFGLETGEIRHGTDPPTFILCMEPFALMPERTAYYVWVGLTIISLATALALLLQGRGLQARSAVALAAMAIIYPPLIWHFYDAQSKILILLLLTIMLRAMERGWDRAAGFSLAVAGLLRIFPLLLLGYLVIQRRWRQLTWTCIGLVAGGLLTVQFFGVGNTVSYGHSLALLSTQQVAWMSARVPANIALGAAVSRLFWFIGGHNLSHMLELLRHFAMFGAQATLLGMTIWATLGLKGEDPDWRALGMWIVASVLLSPTAWVYYMVLFFIPFAQLAAAGNRASQRAQGAAVLSYVLMLLSNIFLIAVLAIIYSPDSREVTRWLMSVMVEGWFVSAMLAYLATCWFTLDWAHANAQCNLGRSVELTRSPSSV